MNGTRILRQASPPCSATKGSGKGKLSLFFAFCPDGTGPEVFATRLRVRPKHFERVEEDKKAGILAAVLFSVELASIMGSLTIRHSLAIHNLILYDNDPAHLEFGRGFLPSSPDSPLYSHPATASLPNKQPMAGSIMFFRYPSIEDTWKRVKEDVYWTEGVWNRGKVQVGEFLRVPSDDE
ncbi:hypothetical protein I317_01788 [Kwoniella heveanensis CBS 569]|nr:hypothetical protein I317_01788 [Kwoniella heveanensis CBS 569]